MKIMKSVVQGLICSFIYSPTLFTLTASQCPGPVDRASDSYHPFIVCLCEVKILSNGGKGIDSKYVYKLV